ncbi:MAG: hypothetical protein HPY85_05030 [Anaerolineae bacterium]|nr:hypothetical protein [Anaerolineae bacterium]
MDDGTLPRLHLNHRQFLQLMAAALAEQEYEYMGSAIGEWLQIFPGDLQTHLFNGCLSFALGKNKLARRHLEKLVELEPFFLPAYLTYQQMDKNNPFINGCILALGGHPLAKKLYHYGHL